MCCVCDATRALEDKKPLRFSWDGIDAELEFEARGKRPEFASAKYRFRRSGDTEWNGWYDTVDLAGKMSRLGTDAFGSDNLRIETIDWLRGGPIQPLLDGLAEQEAFIKRVLEERDGRKNAKTE